MTHGRSTLARLAALGASLLLLTSCGGARHTPVKTTDPLYLLVVDGQQLQLDVISRPAYAVAGTIPIQSVGSTPPIGAVGVAGADSVIVTHTGATEGQQVTVNAGTLRCTLSRGTCQKVIDGWGSSTVDVFSDQVAVPIWTSADEQHGELAWLSKPALDVRKRIHLTPLTPGPMQLAPDGASLYWLTVNQPPNDPTGATQPVYELDRFDLSTGAVTATHSFGREVPGSLAIGPDGSIYVTILYANAGDKSVQTPAPPPPGTTVEVFSALLSAKGVLQVDQNPNMVTISSGAGGTLAVLYAQTETHHIDLFDLASRALVAHAEIPTAYRVAYVSTLSNGDFAAVGSAGRKTVVGIFSVSQPRVEWHTFSGSPIGAAAG